MSLLLPGFAEAFLAWSHGVNHWSSFPRHQGRKLKAPLQCIQPLHSLQLGRRRQLFCPSASVARTTSGTFSEGWSVTMLKSSWSHKGTSRLPCMVVCGWAAHEVKRETGHLCALSWSPLSPWLGLEQICSSAALLPCRHAAAMGGRFCVHNQCAWLDYPTLHAATLYWSSWCNSILHHCCVPSDEREWDPVFLKGPLQKHKEASQKGDKPWEPHQVVLFPLGLS